MPGRNYKADNSYRYGFNGKESDNEVDGEGNQYDYGFRIYNPRLGRFLSVDPLSDEFPWYSPYHFSGNNPVQNIDMDGLEETHYIFVWTDNPEKPVIKLAAWQVGEQTGEINQDGTLEYDRPFSIVAHYPIERGDEVYFVTATYDSEEAFKNAKAKDFTLSIISLGALLGVEAADDYMDKVTMLIGLGSFKKSVKLAVKEAVDAANTLAIKEVKQLNKQVVDKLEKKIVKDASEKAGEEAVKQELKQVKQSSKGAGRAGKQAKLKEVAEDQKQPNHIRGWIQQEQNSIKRGRRKSIRNPPGYDMAHKRGYEAKKGNGYDKSHPQLRRLHKLQHKFDNKGKKNKAGAIKL